MATKTKEELKGVEHYIIKTPDPRLREYWPAADYETSQATLDRMLEMCNKGATDGRSLGGLSSVQVTLPGRVVTASDQHGGWVGLIDPVVVKRSYEMENTHEGCFSLAPGLFILVRRSKEIDVEHTVDGEAVISTLRGYTARSAMHEIDHINGILISDYKVG